MEEEYDINWGEADARVEAEAEEQDGIMNILDEGYEQTEEYANILAEQTALTSTLELGPIVGYGALILGIAYVFYSHLSGNFKPERNRFISKKKP